MEVYRKAICYLQREFFEMIAVFNSLGDRLLIKEMYVTEKLLVEVVG